MEYYVELELVSVVLGRLYMEHWDCFTETQEREELDNAIFHVRIALRLCPNRLPEFYEMLLHCLANSLSKRYEQCGIVEDLGEVIGLHRAALQLRPEGHPYRSISLNNLASSLLNRFEQHGQIVDLDEAIELYRAALQLRPDGHPERSISLGNLAVSLEIRFRQHGQTADLDEAIELSHAALQLRPDGHPDRSESLNNLACFLLTRFEQHGQTVDLDEAIELHHAALQLHPDGHPDRSTYLNNLASSLETRFEQHGQTADLDEAIELHRAALQLHPDSHPSRSTTLNNLAGSLATRFKQYGQTTDLDEAIELHRAALQLCPDSHLNYPKILNNLANSLQTRLKQHGQTADIDEAVELHRAALQLHPDGHPNRSGSLNNLAGALATRFEQHGQTVDIDGAIELLRAALQLRPDGHPDRSSSLVNLALSLLLRFKKFGLTDDSEECIKSLECAAEHKFSSLVIRLEIASLWVVLARDHGHHTSSRPYRAMMLLLQHVLVISPTIHAQHNFLSGKHDYAILTLDAVAHAVEENRLEEAIETLEQGRCLLWSQMRGFRTPLDDLADTNGELAERFRNVSRQLENLVTSSGALQYNSSTAGSGLSALAVYEERVVSEERLKLKRKLSGEQDELIKEIRQIPGFESFLTATPFKVLQRVASEGPVIVVNHSKYRSDVLIILSREELPVVCVPLDREFHKDIITLCNNLVGTRKDLGVFSPGYDEVLQQALKMLWDRVVSKVVKKLKGLGIAEGSRIWWCPTSVLSVLPFHAAGPAGGTKKYLSDYYVSSYTPTLGALISARLGENQGDPAMLIVGDTESLESTRKEILAVKGIIRDNIPSVSVHCILNERACRERVLKRLQKVTWTHFACHGRLGSVGLGSLDSSFKLSDSGLSLLDIIRANVPNAEFAFLSACHTAEQGPFGLFDEVLHLAAAVQFSGFRSVIGTMWEMYDGDGPFFAKQVYSYMAEYEDGEVIHKRSAAALHQAALLLRGQDDVATERWVNLIHIGA